MQQADHVIVFGPDGRIIDQGCPEELKDENSYRLPVDSSTVTEEAESQSTAPIPQKTLQPSAPRTGELDLKRQTGDIKLYSYYYHSIGAVYALAFLVLAAAYIFLGKLPREFHFPIYLKGKCLTQA